VADAKTIFSASLRDEASKQLKQLEGNYRQTMSRIEEAGGGDGGGGNLAQIAVEATSLSGALTMLGATAPQVLAVTKGLEVIGAGVDMAHAAAQAQRLENAYTSLAGQVGVAALSAVGAAASTAGSGVGSMQSSLQSSIESMVGGQLQGALSMDVTWPGMEGPRQDAINENARRLAAIMRDGLGDQEWLGEFKAEAPGIFDEIANSANPQQAAAKILQEFQAGLRPELLDKDAAKERVRQMILGEQSMAALAGEIAQELAQEMGISVPEALGAAQSALGVDNVEGGGRQASFLGGLDANGIATTTTSKIAAQMEHNDDQYPTGWRDSAPGQQLQRQQPICRWRGDAG